MHPIRVIVNGKKAGLEAFRTAIYSARRKTAVELRVTWEHGDVARLVREACADGVRRLVIAGGDGTVNEMVNAQMLLPPEQRLPFAIIPMGTANDFATAAKVPGDYAHALTLAQTGEPTDIDVIQANQGYFINVASGGFGAQVTASTPTALKNCLGGGAYTLSGLVQALRFTPHKGRIKYADNEWHDEIIVSAVCNGSQAGGGQVLAEHAKIDDGLLNTVAIRRFPAEAFTQVLKELQQPASDNEYVKAFSCEWIEWQSQMPMPINLDGEPIKSNNIRFSVCPAAIPVILPANCPLLKR
ncbi:lipid kinase YegS [Gilvimarinus agarilyticus]|uniref:lipid kinase YegS n=1 Tax=Gilvimarinus agarilyticus TaxID=679259 RepID=UPI00059FE047|nr:lipid kinase YegS [Gilvimarinus agarilyticus]